MQYEYALIIWMRGSCQAANESMQLEERLTWIGAIPGSGSNAFWESQWPSAEQRQAGGHLQDTIWQSADNDFHMRSVWLSDRGKVRR